MNVDGLIELFKEKTKRESSDILHVWAVFWANLKIFLSYKTWVITETLSTTASVVMYAFMGLQVSGERVAVAGYGEVNWLAFALVGVATSHYLWMCISRISHAMQHEISEGTLEPIISSLIRMRSYIIGQSIRGFLVSGYFMLGALFIGVFVLKAPLIINFETAMSFIAVLFMMIAGYLGIGITAAGIILVYKKGDPLTFLFASVTEFLGGVLFPLNYLKDYPILYSAAWLMPYTYAVDASRRIFLMGATLTSPDVLNDLVVLAIYTLVFMPIGLWVFALGCNRIRDDGTVATY
jgi:ABC-2 type transport system permease protein